MKDKEIHWLQLDCKNRLEHEDYEYPEQEKLQEVLDLINDDVAWIEGSIGELLHNVIVNSEHKIYYNFINGLAETYFKKLFKHQKIAPRRLCSTIIFNKLENKEAINNYTMLNEIHLVSPLFDVNELNNEWNIEYGMYTATLTRKRNEDRDTD